MTAGGLALPRPLSARRLCAILPKNHGGGEKGLFKTQGGSQLRHVRTRGTIDHSTKTARAVSAAGRMTRRGANGMDQTQQPKYFIVESTVLPDIYLKVAEAKRLLETGEERTVNAATRRADISRSAFYKYKDAIRPFQDMLHGRIVTIQILLRNEPGALSSVLNLLADRGGNVLTINQAIPGGGTAAVTVGLETGGLAGGLEELLAELRARSGVVRCEVLAG